MYSFSGMLLSMKFSGFISSIYNFSATITNFASSNAGTPSKNIGLNPTSAILSTSLPDFNPST